MATLSRLKDAEISNGNLIDADDLDAEFDQLVSESNSQHSRLTDLESNTMTINGQKTFSQNIKVDGIVERSAGNGCDVEGVLLKDGYANVALATDPTSPDDGSIWINTTSHVMKVRLNGATLSVSTSDAAWPKGFIQGGAIQYVSTSQVKIPEGLKCRSDDNTINIEFTSDQTIDITTTTSATATNCLMNGLSESSNTWYYVWAIAKSDGSTPRGLLTTSSTTIATYPTDYTVKRLIGMVRNNSSSNFISFSFDNSFYVYDGGLSYHNGTVHTAGALNVLSAGTSATWAAVSCTSFIPPLSTVGYFNFHSVDAYASIRPTGSSTESGAGNAAGAGAESKALFFKTNTSQSIDYIIRSGTSLYIDVQGFRWSP